MGYNLISFKNKYNYEIISNYTKVPAFHKLDEHRLEDICSFSTNFEDEEELRLFLKEMNFISLEFAEEKIGVLQEHAGQKRIYTVPYAQDVCLFNLDYLKKYFINNLNNLMFMDYFLKEYGVKLANVNLFSEEVAMLKNATYFYRKKNYLPNYASNAMETFLHKFLYRSNKQKEYSLSFTRMFHLVNFIINYENKFNLRKKKVHDDITNQYDLLKHYEKLRNECFLQEEKDAYEKEINKINKNINYLENEQIRRRKK